MIPARLQPLLEAGSPAAELAAIFDAAGYELCLVGGSVRDALLDRQVQDLDFATNAHPEEIKHVVSSWASSLYLTGERFGTIGAIRSGQMYEITTYRREAYLGESRKPRVAFSDQLEEDLCRRDFTINSMAIRFRSTGGPILIDPFGGLSDLAAKTLQTPLGPEDSFSDDPLRMLRLFRFMSTLGFAADEATMAAASKLASRLQIVSVERIRDEFAKLMVGNDVESALWGIVHTGLSDYFLPELSELELQQDPQHRHKDVLAHSIAVVAKTSSDLELRLAALLHDIGKPATRAFTPAGVTFHHHEVVGARMARRRMKQLRFSTQQVADVGDLVYNHMRPHSYRMGWTDAAVRRYVRDAGPLLDKLNELVRCDVTTRNQKRARAIWRRVDELELRIEELRAEEELDLLRPPLDGHQVMEYLGIGPGPEVGRAMKSLYEHRVEHGPYTSEEAYALLDDGWSS